MRKTIISAAFIGTALSLTACSQTDSGTDTAVESSETADTEIAPAAAATSVVDANTATAEQLSVIEAVSPKLAEAIVAGQPFASVTDLNSALLAAGTPEEASAVLKHVFVPVNLNKATKEEIQLIPGMTDKMVHEFEEYRPYEDMAEFDREIGKYVDEAEVARFRNYVTL